MPAISCPSGAVHTEIMKRQLTTLIIIGSAFLGAWTLAAPPAGTIGASVRSLFTDATGNIGIKTSSPATLLDINGTTTIRKSLDMANNRILTVATPTIGLDAINKTYADTVIGSMGPAIKLWGEGRPGASVVNANGECTNTIAGSVIKVSRSTRVATWDGARAACPANWWVCSAAERGTLVCGNTSRNILYCNVPSSTDDLQTNTANWGWVSNTASTTTSLLWGKIKQAATGGTASDQYMCNLLPVWCCSY